MCVCTFVHSMIIIDEHAGIKFEHIFVCMLDYYVVSIVFNQVVMGVARLYHHLAPKNEVGIIAKPLIRLLKSHR